MKTSKTSHRPFGAIGVEGHQGVKNRRSVATLAVSGTLEALRRTSQSVAMRVAKRIWKSDSRRADTKFSFRQRSRPQIALHTSQSSTANWQLPTVNWQLVTGNW